MLELAPSLKQARTTARMEAAGRFAPRPSRAKASASWPRPSRNFGAQRERSGEQRAQESLEYWKQRLVLLIESQVMAERSTADGQRALESLAFRGRGTQERTRTLPCANFWLARGLSAGEIRHEEELSQRERG